MEIEEKKAFKCDYVRCSFKAELNKDIEIEIKSMALSVGTEYDLVAYKKIYDVMLDGETTTIKDRNNKFFVVTKEELFSVIRQMTLWGASQWGKKEKLLAEVDKATTIEELENIQW